MKKYQVLLNVLDRLRYEAPPEFVRYRPLDSECEKLDYARSLSYIHLFLKVRFGILEFSEREKLVCDGPDDGGIDAYFIDKDSKHIFFLQSKFRTTAGNFEQKNISIEELIRMDVDRISKGQTTNEQGIRYNNKVLALIDAIQKIEDIGRYDFTITLLANIPQLSEQQLRRVVGDFPVEVIDYNSCYQELLLPVVSGTYYNSANLIINIDLPKKEVAQSRIQYTVSTEFSECDITILFVPTLEIAKNLHKYKNSILRFNPRSYLSLSTNKVNQEIAKTLREKTGNEFALFNNGITMLSDDTRFNERTGRPYRGQLIVTNPQIINGGQTAYTLSHLYETTLPSGETEQVFASKEVMLKVITFVDNTVGDGHRFRMIEAISKATNQQTSVVEADRRSNDKIQVELQQRIYGEFGYFYERKKGEFFDGLESKYIDRDLLVERELLLRVALAIGGSPEIARRTSATVLFQKESFAQILSDSDKYRDYFFAYQCYKHLERVEKSYRGDKKNKYGVVHYGNALRYGKYSVVYVTSARLEQVADASNVWSVVETEIKRTLSEWLAFEEFAKKNVANREYFRRVPDPITGEDTLEANFDSYYKVQNVKNDLDEYFELQEPDAHNKTQLTAGEVNRDPEQEHLKNI